MEKKKNVPDRRLNNGGKVVPITFEERKEIEKFAKLKISAQEISKSMGRGRNSVAREFRRCGSRQEYTAAKAEEHCKAERKKQGDASMIIFTEDQLNRARVMIADKKSHSYMRREMKFSLIRYQRLLKELKVPALNLFLLADEMENRLYVVEEQIKMLSEILEMK